MAGAFVVALAAIVAMPPGPSLAAIRTAPPPPSVTSDLTAQKIWFKPPLTGTVGDSTTLSGAADSQLPVTFKSADLDRCKVDDATLTFIKVGNCRVIASQAGDGATWAPAPNVIVAIEVSMGYHAKATASHLGVVRTDGAIQVGDVLSVSLATADTAVKACTFTILTAGGWLMRGDGAAHPDGSCSIRTVVPEPSDAAARAVPGLGRGDLDLCVGVESITFADGKKRLMATSDRKEPGGFGCNNRQDRTQDQVLDFAFDGTGTPATFSSSPHLLSWNIGDWDPSYVPLKYNADWHLAFPAWVKGCKGPSLNGEWTTSYQLENRGPGCPDWSLRLPGMLPRAMPWDGQPASWHVSIVMEYTNDLGKRGQTFTSQAVPYMPSDGEFRSSFPAISPTDVARARYVHVGDRWQPAFRISGAEATSCHLHLTAPGEGQDAEYSAPVDVATGVCAFDVPAFVKEWAYSQYFVSFTTKQTNGRSSFGSGIVALAPPTQPTIPDPIANANGTTTITADPGASQAMTIEMSVAMGASGVPRHHLTGAHRKDRGPDKKVPATDGTSLCSAVSYTSALPRPNVLFSASTTCALPRGVYEVTARLVDGTGAVVTSHRTITVSATITVLPSYPHARED